MELEGVRKFSILDSSETSTLAFMINAAEDGSRYRTLQKLDCAVQQLENGMKRTFFVNDLTISGDIDIVLVTLGDGKARLNMAILREGKLLVSKNSGKKEKLNEDVHSDSKRNFNN